LDRHPALALLDEHDRADHENGDDRVDREREVVRLHLDGLAHRGRQPADDAGKDDEADAVADAALADQLTEPHEDEGAGGERGEDREGQAQVRRAEVREHARALHEHAHPDALQERERHREHAGIGVDLVPPVLALLGEALERRDRLVEEGHDDRGVDIGVHPEGDDAEPREAAAGEEVEQPEELVVLEDRGELGLVDARQRHVREEPEHQQHREGEQDLDAEVRRPEGIPECLEDLHALASPSVE